MALAHSFGVNNFIAGAGGVSPPQPLYPYEDIPTSLSGIGNLIQVNPQVSVCMYDCMYTYTCTCTCTVVYTRFQCVGKGEM